MTKNDSEALIRALLGTYFPWILLFLTLITTLTLTAIGTPIFDAYLRSAVFFMGGIQGIWAASAHLLSPEKTAAQIGWKSNGFQTEMGFTNLALGISGVLSWFNPSWVIPVALIVAIIFAGCAYIHIKDRLVNHNDAPCNSGPMLYSTIVTSLSLFAAILLV